MQRERLSRTLNPSNLYRQPHDSTWNKGVDNFTRILLNFFIDKGKLSEKMGRKASGLNSIFIEYGSRVTDTSTDQLNTMAAAALTAVHFHRASVTLPLSDQLKSYGLKFQTIGNKRLHLE